MDIEIKEGWLLLWECPNSVLADTYVRLFGKADSPICHFLAGYSAGWLSEALNTKLATIELRCKAMGHRNCRFLVGDPKKIYFLQKDKRFNKPRESYKILHVS